MNATERLRFRLLGDTPSPSAILWGWVGPLVLTVVGGLLRFWDLGKPHQLVFDETYYVKQGVSMMQYGFERRVRTGLDNTAPVRADDLFTGDTTDVWGNQPDMVVHPPVGKWMIGLGEWLFGYTNSFGWRFSTALVGTLSILLLARCAWYLFRSPTMATITAFLMAFEGHQFVHSRTGLLDIFVSFFALLMFFCILADRERTRGILARKVGAIIDSGEDVSRRLAAGPFLGLRPWLWAAGVAGGLCAGTKWSGAFFVAAFGLMVVFWGIGARRAAGIKNWFTGTILKDGLFAFVAIVFTGLLTYIGSWAGWFASQNAYNRDWAAKHPGAGEPWMGADLNSLWMYHVEAMKFHVRLTSPHNWQSNPWSWMVQSRPTLFFAEYPVRGKDGCTVESCARYIHNIGTVSIWWIATIAILVLLYKWLFGRDWRAGAILGGWAAGYLPWFNYQQRTIFTFYAVAFDPWVVLMAAYAVMLIWGSRRSSHARLLAGRFAVGGILTLVLLNFMYFWPVYTAQAVPRNTESALGGHAMGTLLMLLYVLTPFLILAGAYALMVMRSPHDSGSLAHDIDASGRGVLATPAAKGFLIGAALLLVIWAWAISQVIPNAPLEWRMWFPSWL